VAITLLRFSVYNFSELAEVYQNCFTVDKTIHSRGTRQGSDLHITYAQKSFEQKTFSTLEVDAYYCHCSTGFSTNK